MNDNNKHNGLCWCGVDGCAGICEPPTLQPSSVPAQPSREACRKEFDRECRADQTHSRYCYCGLAIGHEGECTCMRCGWPESHIYGGGFMDAQTKWLLEKAHEEAGCNPNIIHKPRTVIISSYTCNNSPEYGCHTEKGREEAKRLGGCVLHPAQPEVKRMLSSLRSENNGFVSPEEAAKSPQPHVEVKRYDMEDVDQYVENGSVMRESKFGEYVEYSDYAKLESELERVKQERDDYKQRYQSNERTLTRNDCKQCHGSGEIVDSEEGGLLAKCHCWAAYATELTKAKNAAESQLSTMREALVKLVAAANDVVERTEAPNNIPANNLRYRMDEAVKALGE